jgi:hypothetical protein
MAFLLELDICPGQVKKEAAFLKKSGAKNFYYAGAGILRHPRPKSKEVFCFFFFRKKKHFLICRSG